MANWIRLTKTSNAQPVFVNFDQACEILTVGGHSRILYPGGDAEDHTDVTETLDEISKLLGLKNA